MKKVFGAVAAVIVLLCILQSPAWSQAVPDPTAAGPFATTTATYDFGDTDLTIPGFPGPVEFRATVIYPTGLSGPAHPLLVFLHGRHDVCFQGTTAGAFQWPCPSGQEPIPSFEGYDYIATNLASHGYIVVSISANGINAVDNQTSDDGASARAQLIQTHLNFWNTLNTTGAAPFGTLFVGKVDMTRIGTMGHSRGGEGVIAHFTYNQSLGSPYGIKAVFAIAPTDFNHEVINNVPLAVILPYCDGDVLTLEGVHFYDDSRYNVTGDPTPKHTVLVMGANHDYFNTIWTPSIFPAGSSDDWSVPTDQFCSTTVTGNGRLPAAQQESSGLAYVAAFLRAFVGGETEFLPLLSGAAPAPPSVGASNIHVSYQAPDTPSLRLDVNTFQTSTSLTTDAFGGVSRESQMTPYSLCGGAGEPTPCVSGLSQGQQPHTDSLRGTGQLSQLITGWAPTSTLSYGIPAGLGKAQGYQFLQFRAGVNFSDSRNPIGRAQDFSVILTDGEGKTGTAHVNTAAPGSLFYPPGSVISGSPVPRNILNAVRIPLSSFTSSGLNLNDVRTIDFAFNPATDGGILVTDLAFSSAAVSYIGFVDGATCTTISGWAADRNRLNTPITVDVYDGATLIATVPANESRPDVAAFLGDNGLHGFSIPTPAELTDGATHTIHVEFEGSTTDLSGSPSILTCGASSGNFIGFLDSATCSTIAGWAADKSQLNTSISVELYDGDNLIGIVPAMLSRPDVATFLGDNGLHGFSISTPDSLKTGAAHALHVRFESTATDLSESPASISCPSATPSYIGFVDILNCGGIAGWAADRNRLNTPITVEVYDGTTLILTAQANVSRPDVATFLGDNGKHGFNITLPASFQTGTPHSISVRFETSATNLNGSPASLTCP